MSRSLPLLLLVPLLGAPAQAQSPDRDPERYIILGQRQVGIKNFAVQAPGCHVGVNCPNPGGTNRCGMLRMKHGSVAPPGQLVADRLCATDDFFTVFRNGPASCDPTCSMIDVAGSGANCTSPFAPPIVADLDGDGAPSCSASCVPDLDDLASACGVTLPLPACDPLRPVTAVEGDDCSDFDVVPGNGQCDLAQGVYGALRMRDGAKVVFGAGDSSLCGLHAGKGVRLASSGPATLLIPGRGRVSFNNGADVGTDCQVLRLVTEQGDVRFGRNGDFVLDVCALAGRLRLGHANNVRGHFWADVVGSDRNNTGLCCTPTTTTPTTTTTSSSVTSTSVSSSSSSSTPSSSTTSTTQPGFTRTAGFWKNHPAVTADVLASAGPLAVCGVSLSTIAVGDAASVLEALCISPQGDQRLQLARQLTAAALSAAAGGASFAALAACNAVCVDPGATVETLSDCITALASFNASGDNVPAPWDPAGDADTLPCQLASSTACTILAPGDCITP
jgi:hypothetical protein